MQKSRKVAHPAAKFAALVAVLLGGAVLLVAWGQQLQADCLPQRGIACAENVVPNQLAFAMTVFAVGLVVVGLAIGLYKIGVNGFLADLQDKAGEPAGKRRR